MPSLLDFPNEIVLQIINVVHVEDVCSFSLCNQRINFLSKEALEKHRLMRREYGELDFGTHFGDLDRVPDVVSFLTSLVEHGSRAYYPTKMKIGGCHDLHVRDATWQPQKRDAALAALANCQDFIMAKLEACPYIEKEDERDWAQDILNGDDPTLFALMILFLPNLRLITVGDMFGIFSYFGRLERLISKIAVANRTLTSGPPTPLSKLSHLKLLRCWDIRDDDCHASPSKWLSIVAGLPSLRSLSGEGVFGHCSRKTRPCPGTELTDIGFTNSDIDAQTFKHLLSRTRALETFSYSYEAVPFSRAKWEPQQIARLLRKHAGHSLKVLDLTCFPGYSLNDVGIKAPFAKCLTGFKVLSRVYLNHSMFIQDPSSPKVKANKKIHRLVDLLPASIEIVDLIDPLSGKAEALAMMDGLPELKPSRVPFLREVRLEIDETLGNGFMASFGTAGINLVWWKAADMYRPDLQAKALQERVRRDALQDREEAEELDARLAALDME